MKKYILYSILFLFFSLNGLIRVRRDLRLNQYFTFFNEARNLLRQEGLVFVGAHDKADVIFTNKMSPQLLRSGIPIIILEDRDHATVPEKNMKFLCHPLVKAYFQTYSLDPINLNNHERFADCYHYGLVNTLARLGNNERGVFVNPACFEKIKTVVCTNKHSLNNRFAGFKKGSIDFEAPRPLDVFFAGSLTQSNFSPKLKDAYRWHRLAAINAITSMRAINSFILRVRGLPFDEYMQKIRNSKIVVSPWGWGEFCYRDFEAMLGGAVLIKPDTSFIKTVPNIYQNNVTYVPCSPDFSDLQQKIRDVLDHYDEYRPMRQYARELLLEYGHHNFAKDFASEVKKVLYGAS